MFYVTNGKLEFGVTTENQLSPFLANGYRLVEKDVPVKQHVMEIIAEPVEIKVEEVIVEQNTRKYTKTEINRMSLDDLRKLAKANEINVKPTDTGAYLKKILIEILVD